MALSTLNVDFSQFLPEVAQVSIDAAATRNGNDSDLNSNLSPETRDASFHVKPKTGTWNSRDDTWKSGADTWNSETPSLDSLPRQLLAGNVDSLPKFR